MGGRGSHIHGMDPHGARHVPWGGHTLNAVVMVDGRRVIWVNLSSFPRTCEGGVTATVMNPSKAEVGGPTPVAGLT